MVGTPVGVARTSGGLQRDAPAERDPGRLCAVGRADGIDYDYLACVDPETFEPPGPLMIAAARFGETRLIDNLRLDG